MEQSQGDDLARPEVGLGVFGDGTQLLIDLIKQRGDKLHGGSHAALLVWEGCHATSMEEGYDSCKPKNLTILVCKDLYILYSLQETNTIGYQAAMYKQYLQACYAARV